MGTEERQLAILGEGNLSADCGDGTFWVKVSGSNMATIDRSGFSRVRYEVVMDLAALKDPSSERMRSGGRVIYLLNRSIDLLTDWMKSCDSARCESDLLNSM